ncbi:MAG: hypothetical protein L6367_12795, partial [Cellulomonas sp.]|nr:hypothetical protein [Cellulomonas sp.]
MTEPRVPAAAPVSPVSRPRRIARLGPLGRRLVLAFSLVSLVAVVLLTVAARAAVDRGLTVAEAGSQVEVAQRVAAAVGAAYRTAGGWGAADLTAATDLGTEAGFAVLVRDLDDATLASTLRGQGAASPGGGTTAAVLVDEVVVGSVWVGQRGAVSNAEAT